MSCHFGDLNKESVPSMNSMEFFFLFLQWHWLLELLCMYITFKHWFFQLQIQISGFDMLKKRNNIAI